MNDEDGIRTIRFNSTNKYKNDTDINVQSIIIVRKLNSDSLTNAYEHLFDFRPNLSAMGPISNYHMGSFWDSLTINGVSQSDFSSLSAANKAKTLYPDSLSFQISYLESNDSGNGPFVQQKIQTYFDVAEIFIFNSNTYSWS